MRPFGAADYLVELLLDVPVTLAADELRAALTARVGAVELVDAAGGCFVFQLPRVRAPRRGEDAPYCVIVEPAAPLVPGAALAAALAQTWDWPEAHAVVAGCRASLRVHDRLAGELDAERRLHAFHGVVDAVAERAGARAVHWTPSERVIDARGIARRYETWGPLGAALNVRQFRVGDGEGTLLDTVGLAALGLPDVECRFAGVPPARVAALVGGTADYLVRHGDVIRDGETLDRTAERWTCRRAEALVGPRRTVLAVEPRPSRRAHPAG